MSAGWYVSENDIVKWTDTKSRQAQEILPLLVKRLIFASVNMSLIRFPSGDSIVEKGWDGILKTDCGNAFVPKGDSVWELGTEKRVFTKANSDFTKRTNNPGITDRKNSTFVFVTSRKWPKHDEQIKKWKSENQWLDIRILTSQELSGWLEQCPAVHRWFARLIGNRPDGAWDAEQAWDNWSLVTKPPSNINLVLAGRNKQSAQLAQLLSLEPSIVNVTAENKMEAYAFTLATIKKYTGFLPRLLVVRDPKEWDVLIDGYNPLILIPLFENLPTLSLAAQHGHWVILPSASDKKASITLVRASEEEQIKALVEMGLSDADAQHVVHSSRGKLHVIRRHCKLAQAGQQRPHWANPENAEPLVAVLLAGSWLSDNTNDCEKLSYLSSIPYDKLEQILNKWIRTGDYPAEHLGNKWQIVSYEDTWQFLSPFITELILNRFGEVAVDVLTEADPRFELPPTERWLAVIHKKVTKFSTTLRHGLSEGLAILGSFGDNDYRNLGCDSIQNQVSYWVRRILIDDMSEIRWGSLAPELPMLAEASPEIFLQAVETGLEGKKPPVMSLFTEEGPMSGCLHFGLLRGLECVSWDLNYTSRVVSILATLAVKDTGGTWANRPYNTLNEIFRGWFPQTKASLDKRMEILDSLIVYKPDLGWKLLIDLLPEPQETSTPIGTPYFRDWIEGWEKGVSRSEYQKHICSITERVLKQISKQPEKTWLNVEKIFSSLPHEYLNRAINQLDKDSNILKGDAKTNVYNEIMKIVSHHRQYASAKWAIPKEYIDKLYTICQKLIPEDLVSRHKSLFDNSLPPIPNPVSYVNHEEYYKRSEEARLNALEEIWCEEGIDGIERLVNNVQLPRLVGNSLSATTFYNRIEQEILSWLEKEDTAALQAARSYVYAQSYRGKQEWRDTVYKKFLHSWPEKAWTSFCLGLPFNKVLFDFLERLTETIQRDYWKNVQIYYLTKDDAKYAQWVVKTLLTNERPFAAINAAANYLQTIAKNSEIDSEVLVQALEQTASNQDDFKSVRPDLWLYDLKIIITEIAKDQKIDQSRIAMIEWFYLPVFRKDEIQPRILIKEVLKNPKFFCELICMMFKAHPPIDNEFSSVPSAIIEQRALNAAHLIKLIDAIPGQNGLDIDLDELDTWVRQARDECTVKNRKVIGDQQIGQILSHSPIGKDNIWPHETVRDIIERYLSHDIEKGIEIGKYNQRGVVTRSLSEGGEPERKIAKEYENQALQIRFQFPRTAGMLLRMAEDYKRHAIFEDRDKEIMNCDRID